ncbi:hypothetical protein NHP200010_04270 [Helicobacter bizzozeronii]|uniref:hypothetical protein n=1 Tax=Helicobacter bizzozeronii TaxID=56877 RepID=UPI00244D9427|nr:hypothetical protein [Helicobacter bizzozeronii]GMB92716.1 hypothetical protein NHP200010_04270 [Helicobacter bizzozeronii]
MGFFGSLSAMCGGELNSNMDFVNNKPQPPTKYQQYKAEIEAVKKKVEEKRTAFDALQKPKKG